MEQHDLTVAILAAFNTAQIDANIVTDVDSAIAAEGSLIGAIDLSKNKLLN